MKNKLWFSLAAIMMLGLLLACGSNGDDNKDNGSFDVPNDTHENGKQNGDTNGKQNGDDVNGAQNGDDEPALAAEWLPYFGQSKGNISGNVNQGGRVTYDATEKVHYVSSNNRLYRYDPFSNQRTMVYEFITGSGTHLNVHDDYIYLINNDQGALYRFDVSDESITRLLAEDQGGLFYLYRNGTRFHLLHEGPYGIEWGLYSLNDNWIASRRSGIHELSEASHRVLIRSADSLSFQYRDAGTGAGSTWMNFETEYEAESIKDYLFLKMTHPNKVTAAFIIEKADASGIYVYDGVEETLIAVKLGNYEDFSNLNFDGTFLYFLENNQLYRSPLSNLDDVELHMTLSNDIAEVNIINHFVYYRLQGSNIIYQVHPDTSAIKAFD